MAAGDRLVVEFAGRPVTETGNKVEEARESAKLDATPNETRIVLGVFPVLRRIMS